MKLMKLMKLKLFTLGLSLLMATAAQSGAAK